MSPQEQLFRPSDRCGPYEINSFLARGGMGEVYLATHVFNGRKAAIKVLQLSHTGDAKALGRIRQEALFLCKLNHPNIVTTYDSNIAEDGTIWIAMERLQGESLRDIVGRHGRVPPAVALGMVSDVTRGVAAAHELDAIHRDLKPENIYVTVDGRVKVLDFGIAKFGSYELKNTDPGRGPVGTPFYMSPEQIQGLRVDPRSDVYSLGLVLYELLAGHHPFLPQGPYERLPDFRELTAWHLGREPIPLSKIVPGLPEEIYDAVETALRKNPNERFANMDDFGRALRAARRRVIALDPDAPTRWTARPEEENSSEGADRGDDDAVDQPVRKPPKRSRLAMQPTLLRPEPIRVTTVPTPLAPPERRRIVADTIKDSPMKQMARGFGASWAALFHRSIGGHASSSESGTWADLSHLAESESAAISSDASAPQEKRPYLTRRFWAAATGLGTALGVPSGILLAVAIHFRGGHLGSLNREARAAAPPVVRTAAPTSEPTSPSAVSVPRTAHSPSSREHVDPPAFETVAPGAPPTAIGESAPGARPMSTVVSAPAVKTHESSGSGFTARTESPSREPPPKNSGKAGSPKKRPSKSEDGPGALFSGTPEPATSRRAAKTGRNSTLVEPDWSADSLDVMDYPTGPAGSVRAASGTSIH